MADEKVNQRIPGISFAEIGTTGIKQSSGYVYEEFLPALQWPRAGAIYQEMSSNDPVITAILLCARQLIRNVTWKVKAASDDPKDQEAAAFLRSCMHDMSHTWSSFVDDMLSCFVYGWSYHEIIYKKRSGKHPYGSKPSSKYNDGRIGWRKLPSRAQVTLAKWDIDNSGSINGLYQNTWYTGSDPTRPSEVYIPITKALLFRTTTEKNNPEGRSLLRGAYRPWYFKKHIEEVEGIGVERDLAGLPVITAPSGIDLFDTQNKQAVDTKNSAMALVASIRRDRNEGVVMSDGWKLELLSSKSSRAFDTNSIINRYDQRMAITLLADIVMMGGDKVGSFALAKTKESMLAASLDAHLRNACDVLNEYAVPRLFELNTFEGLSALPMFVTDPVVAPSLKDLGDYIKNLSGASMPLFPDVEVENYLRRTAGLPEVDPDSKEREAMITNAEEAKKAQKAEKPPTDKTSTEGGESSE